MDMHISSLVREVDLVMSMKFQTRFKIHRDSTSLASVVFRGLELELVYFFQGTPSFWVQRAYAGASGPRFAPIGHPAQHVPFQNAFI